MKKNMIMIALALMASIPMFAQETAFRKMPILGEKAPSFTAQSTNGTIHFPADFGNSWKILFSHPADYTPVCTSEIYELAAMKNEFEKLNVKVAVVSTDNLDRHVQWKKIIEGLSLNGKGNVQVTFPLIADDHCNVCKTYGMVNRKSKSTLPVRGVFVISPENKIESVIVYPNNVGRNMEEIKRVVIALQTAKTSPQVLIPANWEPGNPVLLKYLTPEQSADMSSNSSDIYSPAWFMFYSKEK